MVKVPHSPSRLALVALLVAACGLKLGCGHPSPETDEGSGGAPVSELDLAELHAPQADEVLQAAGAGSQVAPLEPGLPELHPLQEMYLDGHTASISLVEGNGDLLLVVARGTTESELWLLRRDRNGEGFALTRSNEGWNRVEVDSETETHRRLYLRVVESQQQVRYVWGDSVFASDFRVGETAPRIEDPIGR